MGGEEVSQVCSCRLSDFEYRRRVIKFRLRLSSFCIYSQASNRRKIKIGLRIRKLGKKLFESQIQSLY